MLMHNMKPIFQKSWVPSFHFQQMFRPQPIARFRRGLYRWNQQAPSESAFVSEMFYLSPFRSYNGKSARRRHVARHICFHILATCVHSGGHIPNFSTRAEARVRGLYMFQMWCKSVDSFSSTSLSNLGTQVDMTSSTITLSMTNFQNLGCLH